MDQNCYSLQTNPYEYPSLLSIFTPDHPYPKLDDWQSHFRAGKKLLSGASCPENAACSQIYLDISPVHIHTACIRVIDHAQMRIQEVAPVEKQQNMQNMRLETERVSLCG